MKFVTICIFMICNLGSAFFAKAAGWSSRGGGSGVALFKTTKAAQAARALWKQKKPLTSELIEQIVDLQVTDMAEHPDFSTWVVYPQDTELTYLDRILTRNLFIVSPLMLMKIQKAIRQVGIVNIPSTDLRVRPVHDLGQTNLKLESTKYAFVQIAERRIESGSVPMKVQLLVDARLSARLGGGSSEQKIVQRAALILHEALYLMGYGLGQQDSSRVRLLTAVLLSSVDYQVGSSEDPLKLRLIHFLFTSGFSDFLFYEQGPRSEISQSLARAHRNYHTRMEAKVQYLPQNASRQEYYAVGTAIMLAVQDPGEAFLAAAEMGLASRQYVTDFYSVFEDGPSGEAARRQICRYVSRQPPSSHSGIFHVMSLANQFCSQRIIKN